MMIQPQHAIAGGLFALSLICPQPDTPDAPDTPQAPNFDCSTDTVLLPTIDFELHCDLNPPQILAARLDGSDWGMNECDHSGGRVMHDNETNRFYCINMDY